MLPVPRSLRTDDTASHPIGPDRQSCAQSWRTLPAAGTQAPEAFQSGRQESAGYPDDSPVAKPLSISDEGDAVNMEMVSSSSSYIERCGLTEEEDVEGIFKSSIKLHCYGCLFGKGRLTVRQYDRMREVESALCGSEQWPSRWRLARVGAAVLERTATVRWQRTSRTLLVGKGKTMQKLPDARDGYVPFSAHVVRDFADPVTVILFHDVGESALGSKERQEETFQTLAARDPSHFNFRRGFHLNGDLYKFRCTMTLCTSAVEHMEAHESTGIAEEGDVTLSEEEYAIPTSLRVGDFTSSLSLCSTSRSPPYIKACFAVYGSCAIRFTRDCAVYIKCMSPGTDAAEGSWLELCSATQITLSSSPVEVAEQMPAKDQHVLYAT